ncbi:MAG: ABC transporter ATP-binding protein, partial [Brevibacterium aurantiacum]|nr:ABC transporter ATP-binding protein [Brevibacterium aurantiacum]
VIVSGKDVLSVSGEQLRKMRGTDVSMVFQEPSTALNPVYTVGWQIAEGLRAHDRRASKAELKTKVIAAMEQVGIPDAKSRFDYYPHQFSGGQKQRVGIARALAAEPKVLLCDEPTSALDATTTDQILGLIRSLRDRLGITVLIITHEMSVIREICDSVTLLADGRVAKTGKLAEVISEPGSTLAKDLVPLPPIGLDDTRSSEGSETGTARLVEVSLAGTNLPTVLTSAQAVGVGADSILAGAVETIEGKQVGRIRFTVATAAASQELITPLEAEGIYAEEAA